MCFVNELAPLIIQSPNTDLNTLSEYLNISKNSNTSYKVSECCSVPFVRRNYTTLFGVLMGTTQYAESAVRLEPKS